MADVEQFLLAMQRELLDRETTVDAGWIDRAQGLSARANGQDGETGASTIRIRRSMPCWSRPRSNRAEEIRPISLERDRIADPRETFNWDIIIKGSELGFRTCAVPKEWGGAGLDFVSQALVMMELARGDSAIAKTFSQCWKWSHLIAASCTPAQRDEYLVPS